jgi:hypothetical protein
MSLATDAEYQQQASSKQRERLERFVQIVSSCDDLRDRENAALRAQVHDLTELLAAFDLCALQDAHLSAVRDRAFQRDLAPDRELLQAYFRERQVLEEELVAGMVGIAAERSSDPGESISSDVTEANTLPLPLRVELLEKDVLIVKLQNKLLEERLVVAGASRVSILDEDSLMERSGYSGSEGEPGRLSVGYDGDPRPSGSRGSESFERDSQASEVEGYREQDECSIFENDSERMIHELQQRIVELEDSVEVEVTKNGALQQRIVDLESEVETETTVLQQQNHQILAAEDILQEFGRRRQPLG